MGKKRKRRISNQKRKLIYMYHDFIYIINYISKKNYKPFFMLTSI